MLRGVSKRIIEVNDTGSELFEKALFFVKTDGGKTESELQKEAKKIVTSYFSEDSKQHQGFLRYTDLKKKRRRKIIALTSALMLCCIAVAVLLKIVL